MATQGQQAPQQPAHSPAGSGRLVEYDEFIESQLRKTRGHVRSVDIAAAVMVLLAGTLAFFLLTAVVDHWLIPGGLGFWGRLILLGGYLAAAVYWIASEIVPLAIKRINPLYAAEAIERSRPTLKNTLLNFLMFRANPAGVHQRVLAAIEEQAATNLAGTDVDSAVDRSKLIRLGYVLVAVLIVCAGYMLFSPKDLLKTVGRVAMPWAEISAPTRTTIDEVSPGDAEAFRGQQVTVKARISGLPDEGRVLLHYTTADRQIVDRAVEMSRPADDYRYVAVLPAGDSSLQQTLSYTINAGDAVSRPYTITVVAAPTIVVEAVEYEYPSYTGMLKQRVEHQGDLKAIEGTRVTLEALANQNIDAAHVDFECNEALDLRMQAQEQTAKATFTLSLGEDRQTPAHTSYQLIFKNAAGARNPQPVRHQIEVTRDIPPEVQFVAPKRDEIELPADAGVELEVVASDPDFALAGLTLAAAKGDTNLVEEKLLAEAWRGQLVKKYRFLPGKLGLKAGDVVDYWAVAVDSKDPQPNRTQTARRRIRITSPSGRKGDPDQLAQNDKRGDGVKQPAADGDAPKNADQTEDAAPPPDAKPQEPQPSASHKPSAGERNEGQQSGDKQPEPSAASPGDKSQDAGGNSAEQGADDAQSGAKGGEPSSSTGDKQQDGESVPNDGTNDGEAIERILKHRDQESGGEQNPEQKQSEQPEEQPGEKPQPGQPGSSGQDGSENSGEKQSSPPKQSPGKQAGGKKESGEGQESPDDKRPGDEQQPGEKQSGDTKQSGKKQSGENDSASADKQPTADKQSGGTKQGSPEQGGKKQNGKKQGAQGQEKQDGESPRDEKQPTKQPGKQGQPSGKPDSSQAGKQQDGQPGEKMPPSGEQSGEQQSGEKQSGDQQSGEKQSEETPSGESPAGEKSPSQNGGQKKPSGTNDPQASDESGQGETKNPPGEKSQPGDQPGAEHQRGEGNDPQSKQGQKQDSKQKGQPQKDGRPQTTQDNNTREDGTPQDPATKGQGAQSQDDSTRKPDQKSKQSGKQQPDAKGGDGEQQKGESGAGQESKDSKGSPKPGEQSTPKPKSKQPGAESQDPMRDDDAQSPSNSKKESDTEGQEGGDQSGGGKKGGGQKANKPGTGSAGQNTAADEGAGRSEEKGAGETGDRAGSDRAADGKTGQGGSESGEGSKSKSSGGPNEKPGGDQPSEDSSESPSSKSPSGENGKQQGSQGGPNPSGGTPNANGPNKQDWKPGTDEADEANLDYARKATDLAVEHLKDELRKDQPDQELLDRLGWSRADLEKFVKRWESLRSSSTAPGDQGNAAQRELDETLRSLGLRPRTTTLKSRAGTDRVQGYQESHRTTPPAEYSESFKAYTQGTARGGK